MRKILPKTGELRHHPAGSGGQSEGISMSMRANAPAKIKNP